MKNHTALPTTLLFLICTAGSASAGDIMLENARAEECSRDAKQATLGMPVPHDALEICTLALQESSLLTKDEVAVHVDRAVLYLLAHEFAKTQADLDAAMALDPQQPKIYINLGALRIEQHRDKAALEALDHSIALGLAGEETKIAYFNRGLARENLGDLKGAYKDYKMAASLDPDWELPKTELSRFKVAPAPARGKIETQ